MCVCAFACTEHLRKQQFHMLAARWQCLNSSRAEAESGLCADFRGDCRELSAQLGSLFLYTRNIHHSRLMFLANGSDNLS